MSGFGPGVIGEKEFAKQEKVRKERSDLFGPAVRDPSFHQQAGEFEVEPPAGTKRRKWPEKIEPVDGEQRAVEMEHRHEQPPIAEEPEEDDEVVEEPPEDKTGVPDHLEGYLVGIRDLKKTLKANPLLVDQFMQAELHRPEGMRKTAIEEMLAAENRRAEGQGGPRAEVVETLEAWLEDVLEG